MRTMVCCLLVVGATGLYGGDRPPRDANLEKYIARVQTGEVPASPQIPGSIWVDSGRLASLTTDYKGRTVGDLITVLVVQDVTALNSGTVGTDRSLSASSGVDSLPGKLKTGGVASLLGLHSAQTLSGKGQATTTSKLRTSLAGRVVAVLPSGNLVIAAERSIAMNHERQTIILRGVVRPGDVGPDNTIVTNAISNLELELKGKGVISDGTRPPHPLLRAILRILNF